MRSSLCIPFANIACSVTGTADDSCTNALKYLRDIGVCAFGNYLSCSPKHGLVEASAGCKLTCPGAGRTINGEDKSVSCSMGDKWYTPAKCGEYSFVISIILEEVCMAGQVSVFFSTLLAPSRLMASKVDCPGGDPPSANQFCPTQELQKQNSTHA